MAIQPNLTAIPREPLSRENTRKIVCRAVTDENLRGELFPDSIFEQYELTDDERNALRSIPAETRGDFANQLEIRISISLIMFAAAYGAAEGAAKGAAKGAAYGAAESATSGASSGAALGAQAAPQASILRLDRLADALGLGGGGGSGPSNDLY